MITHTLLAALPAVAFSGGISQSIERVARRLIHCAACAAPASLAERLHEEWLADFSARPDAVARLRLAIGCCWASRVIASDHCAAKVPATNSLTGPKAMTTYLHDASFFSRRTAAAVFIFCLHAILIYLLAAGVVQRIATAPPSTIANFVDGPPAQSEPPPRLPPQLRYPRVDLPETPVRIDGDPDNNAIRDVVPEAPPGSAAPLTAPRLDRVLGGPGRGFPSSADFYPPASIRRGETGVASVQVCVDRNGRLTAAPTIAQSSGNPRLDEGATRLAKAGSGHFRPTTENGQPVNSCYAFRVRFAIGT